MSREHLESFLAHVRSINRRKFAESKSSLLGLITYLRTNVDSTQPLTFATVNRELKNPNDPRVAKYQPAIAALIQVWGTAQPYSNEAVRIVPAPLMGGPPQDQFAIPRIENARRFAIAYKKARFFCGLKGGDPEKKMADGLLTSESCSVIGATDPGFSTLPGGGPIFLGEAYDVSAAYTGNNEAHVLRIFLDSTRVTRPLPLRESKAFERGNRTVFRDRDNPAAGYAMADIPPENLFAGLHSAILLPRPNAPRTLAILAAIASHDSDLHTASPAALLDLLRLAIAEHLVSDNAADDIKK